MLLSNFGESNSPLNWYNKFTISTTILKHIALTR